MSTTTLSYTSDDDASDASGDVDDDVAKLAWPLTRAIFNDHDHHSKYEDFLVDFLTHIKCNPKVPAEQAAANMTGCHLKKLYYHDDDITVSTGLKIPKVPKNKVIFLIRHKGDYHLVSAYEFEREFESRRLVNYAFDDDDETIMGTQEEDDGSDEDTDSESKEGDADADETADDADSDEDTDSDSKEAKPDETDETADAHETADGDGEKSLYDPYFKDLFDRVRKRGDLDDDQILYSFEAERKKIQESRQIDKYVVQEPDLHFVFGDSDVLLLNEETFDIVSTEIDSHQLNKEYMIKRSLGTKQLNPLYKLPFFLKWFKAVYTATTKIEEVFDEQLLEQVLNQVIESYFLLEKKERVYKTK